MMEENSLPTWRIIPVSKWLVTPIYKPFRPFVRGIAMVINYLLTGMILQVASLELTASTPLKVGRAFPKGK